MTTFRALRRTGGRPGICLAALLALALLAAPAPASASAFTEGPQWTVSQFTNPTNLPPGGTGVYRVTVTNTGAAPTDGSPIVVTDTLPKGLSLGLGGISAEPDKLNSVTGNCVGLTCEYTSDPEGLPATDAFTLIIPVVVEPGAPSSVTNIVTVSGGGAPAASLSTPTTISSTPAAFGVAPGSVVSVLSSLQAGAHANLTTSLAFNSKLSKQGTVILSDYDRDVVDDLPPGFAADLADTPTCSIPAFDQEEGTFTCPSSSQVGTMLLHVIESDGEYQETYLTPVYSLAPNPGEVGRLGFFAGIYSLQGEIFLRPGEEAVRTTFEGDPAILAGFESFQLTVWGDPSNPNNNRMRGVYCTLGHGCVGPGAQLGGEPSSAPKIPYLISPTQCTNQPLVAKLSAKAWEPEAQPASTEADIGSMTGCDLLEFTPHLTSAPDTTDADTPAGLTVDVKVPQEGLTSPEGLSSGDIKNTTVTLPEGVVINPGQGSGLEACQPSEQAIGLAAPSTCPNASIVGHDEIRTPLLKEKLEGNVYVVPSEPPDIKLMVEAAQPIYGIYIKLFGDVRLNPVTGQLTTTFAEAPALPFTDFKLSFSGGAQAALSTPTTCGIYTTTGDFTPWSTPIGPDVLAQSELAITHGTDGAPCPPSPLPFSPELIAGATTDQAGGYTDFSLLLRTGDDQQRISKLQFKAPPGLAGMIATVPLCQEPQASEGTCPPGSQIGHTVVASGAGPYPLVVPQPGQPPAAIYLTGPYEGAPFGLSIVVPVHVGPFTLETQVVRAKIEVDPHTAAIAITTGPLPQVIDGIRTDLRTVDAVIERPDFMFNPTNCSPLAFAGTATSAEGASAPISSHFQMGSCRALTFKPNLKVATSGKTSRADGASLEAKILYPTGVLGDNQATSQANIAKVKVELPKQLPSRLTTLQKACPAAQFNANPAGCPPASAVGHASATTPELPVPIEGPAYFVSNGSEAFPNLDIVLQGDNVTIILVADTFISKAGITSSTFNTVPDAPVTNFTLTLPEGKYSALAANGNLCQQDLVMPTAFVGQNGATLNQDTHIEVNGCSDTLSIISHSISKRTLKVSVYAPGAGEVKVSGAGLTSATKGCSAKEAVSFTLRQKKAGNLSTKLKIVFTPSKGTRQSKALELKFRK